MRILVLGLLVLACSSSLVRADEPPIPCIICSLDTAMRGLLIPDNDGSDPNPAARFTVTVKNAACVPIPNAVVEVQVGGLANGLTRLCGATQTVAITDANGIAEFNIAGGGCYRGAGAFVIRANGAEVRSYSAVMSPDYAGWDFNGTPGRASLTLTPVDLAAFVTAYHGGVGAPSCHDYNNDGVTDPSDLAVFASAYSGGTRFCTP
jgi:hypothetical protein